MSYADQAEALIKKWLPKLNAGNSPDFLSLAGELRLLANVIEEKVVKKRAPAN